MIHFLCKFRKFSTISGSFLNKSQTDEALNYILSNPKELYLPWIKQKYPVGDHLIFIIGKLRQQEKWKEINSLLPLIHKENCKDIKLYLSILTMCKKAEIPREFYHGLLHLIQQTKFSLSPREISNCIIALRPTQILATHEKFLIIDSLSDQIIKNIKNFTSFDKSYIIDGISLLPCENTFKIFEEFAKDNNVKSLKELSSLCNFLSINRNKEFYYLFEIFEKELLKDAIDNKYVLNQAIHGFSKLGFGSDQLYKYFIKKVWEMRDEIDGNSTGVILSCLIKFKKASLEEKEKLKKIFDGKKKLMKEKHLDIINEFF